MGIGPRLGVSEVGLAPGLGLERELELGIWMGMGLFLH